MKGLKFYWHWNFRIGRDSYFYDWPHELLSLGFLTIEWVGSDWPDI